MQPNSDLHDVWSMFDHMKRLKHLAIMTCHVYKSVYCCIKTIANCGIQLEDVATQWVLWKNFNVVVAEHGVFEPKFKGFMVVRVVIQQFYWRTILLPLIIIFGEANESWFLSRSLKSTPTTL